MKTLKIVKGLAKLGVFTACVVILASIGFELGDGRRPLAPIWPLSGFVVSSLLMRKPRDWPWLVFATGIGVVAADLIRYGMIHPYVVVPMFEPLLAVWLIHRFAGVGHTPPTLAYWVRTMLCAPIVAAAIGGAVGAVILQQAHADNEYVAVWRSWWFADALGMIVVGPALVALLDPARGPETRRMLEERGLELVAFAVVFVSLTLTLFSAPAEPTARFLELRHAAMPALIWAALRFPAWVSFDGLALYAGYSVWQMSLGRGPYLAAGQDELARTLAYQVPTLMTAIGVQMVQVLATERRTTLEGLARSEGRFRGIVESTNEWLWEVDSEMRFVYSSPQCFPLLGYTQEELVGTDSMTMIVPEDRELARQAFESTVGRNLPVQTFLHRDRRKDGSIIHLESNVVPVLDEQGRLIGCRGADRDVSERIATEAAAAALLEEKNHSEKLVALGTVVSGVAHEINNPNQFITLNMPILRQAWADAAPAIDTYGAAHRDWKIAGMKPDAAKSEVTEAIEEVTEGSARIRTIIAELRDFMRGDPGRETEDVDLEKSVRSAVNIVTPSIAARDQRVSIEASPTLPTIRGTRRRIEQVLINLIANASEALDSEPGTISIRTRLMDDRRSLCVEVMDDGPGISTVDLARVMDPFFTTKRDVGGTGLGLAISSRIAREHGGRIELCSQPGKGTTARLILPIPA